jgi:uncharacterized protein
VEIITAEGPAEAELTMPPDGRPAPAFVLVLTHGSGGRVATPDVLAVRDAGLRLGAVTALVTQPYRVKGRRAPGSAERQDAAWLEVIAALRSELSSAGGASPGGRPPGAPRSAHGAEVGAADRAGLGRAGVPLIQGGRSNGARVACRTAGVAGARGVIALAFPLHPPGHPERSRAAELAGVGTDVLVINGSRDPFGIPEAADRTQVVVLDSETHALSGNPGAAGRVAESWLRELLG